MQQMHVPVAESAPIDAVITWVDGSDPRHRAKLNAYLSEIGRQPAAAAATRFQSVGEIDYCVVSLLRFAPFLRRIHVVTDEQVPALFERAQRWPAEWRDKLVRVDHQQIFAGHDDVTPSFNSRAIETVLYRIPGLAEQFVYLNDDFMLVKPVRPEHWFRDGKPVLHGRWRSAPELRWSRRLRARWAALIGRPAKDKRPSHQDAQALAARLAGYEHRFLEHDHHPHPLRRSTLARYFDDHPEVLRRNISPRLRDASQFLAQMLAGHLEVRAGTAWLEPSSQTANIKPDSLSPTQLVRRLRAVAQTPDLLFVCIQSLDQASPAAQATVLAWLDATIGRDPV